MKLTNPTDDELNAAFAEKVAGLKEIRLCSCKEKMCYTENAGSFPHVPDFTTSADAVLPWLEKNSPWRADCGGQFGYLVQVWKGASADGNCYAQSHAESFPRAAVIALLRAHGVEVEFTK